MLPGSYVSALHQRHSIDITEGSLGWIGRMPALVVGLSALEHHSTIPACTPVCWSSIPAAWQQKSGGQSAGPWLLSVQHSFLCVLCPSCRAVEPLYRKRADNPLTTNSWRRTTSSTEPRLVLSGDVSGSMLLFRLPVGLLAL